jgi:demethylmenaquinone methyltransferase/2-methoxy-6-polyprenyl-1,4-benzoquinol methylase
MSNKQKKIVSMFDNIAKTYDITNRVLSMGIDKSWRKKACNLAFKFYDKQNISKIVDVACGTGDMMGHWEKIAKENSIDIEKLIGVDPSIGMLEVAKKRFENYEFINTGAIEIPLEDNSVDIISISYGIRNVVQRQKAFQEFRRILKPNGLLVILEFTKNEKKNILDSVRDVYMNKIMPKIGGLISKNKEAYEYLPNSIEDFLTTEKLIQELEDESLKVIFSKSYSMKMSTTFISRKI